MGKILIISNDLQMIQDIGDKLIIEGFDVYIANNYNQGLLNAIQHFPHIIIFDIVMSEINVLEGLSKLRNDEKVRNIPFIYLISESDKHSGSITDLDPDDFLLKPFTINELVISINTRFDKYYNSQIKNALNVITSIIKLRFRSLESEVIKQKEQIEDINVEKFQINTQLKEKEAELLNVVIKSVETNNVLHSLIKQLEGEIVRSENSPAQKKFLKDLKFNTEAIFRRKDSLRNYLLKFNQLYPDFIDKIINSYPQLTPLELTLISSIKFNLNTNQIASILSISPDSVRKSRYRLKKKINLAPNKSLQTYIHEFH